MNNQRKVDDFVNNEVKANVNDMVQDLIEADKINLFEYIIPKTEYEGEEYTQEQIDLIIDEKNNDLEKLNDKLLEETSEEKECEIEELISNIEEEISEIEDLEFDVYDEPMEYYIVSSFLAEQLKKKGEIIIDSYMAPIWGRTCSGQAIFIDSVIIEIAKENGII